MATQATLSLLDGTTPTPVTHTFSADRVDANGIAWWVDREHNSGLLIGQAVVSAGITRPKSGSTSPYRVNYKMKVPRVNGTLDVIGMEEVNMSVTISQNSVEQDRVNILALFVSFLNTVAAKNYVHKLESAT